MVSSVRIGRVVLLALLTLALLGPALLVLGPGSPAQAVTRVSGPRAVDPQVALARESDGLRAGDVPLDDELSVVADGVRRTGRLSTDRFSMVGLTWRGAPADVRVQVRTGRSWEPWRELEELSDGPDPASAERRLARRGTDLQWIGGVGGARAADAVRVEVSGPRPHDATLTLIQPTSAAVAATARETTERGRASKRPTIRGRDVWGADDRLRSGRPAYNRTIQQVHIHHTVNSNAYGRRDVAGLIRGMYRYHTQSLGWSDVGYNFLVDRFGRTWLGRAGGAKRAVHGAHTLGFNSTSTGVAVIGNFESGRPGKKVVTALVRLAAWKLDRYHRKPRGTVTVFSHGSDRYSAGRRVRLPSIDGHRDTNQTACPGQHLYELIPKIRRRAAKRVASF